MKNLKFRNQKYRPEISNEYPQKVQNKKSREYIQTIKDKIANFKLKIKHQNSKSQFQSKSPKN